MFFFRIRDYQSPPLLPPITRAPFVSYRHPPNLRDLLVRAAYGQETKEAYRGNSQCQQPRCKTCPHMKTGTSFCNKTMGKRFRVKATADCRTRNVVYLIGQTENALRVCLTGHRLDIKHRQTDRPVAKHFSLPDHSMEDLSIMEIEKIYREDTDYRR